MTDVEVLLAAVVAEPSNMTVRLVYSDAVQEAGDELRAEFVRLSVEWEEVRLTAEKTGPERKRRNAVHKRLCHVFHALHRDASVSVAPLSVRSQKEIRFSHVVDGVHYFWRSGFVESVYCPFWKWVGQCRDCRGEGRIPASPISSRTDWCPACRGRINDRSDPVGPALVKAHPLVRSVATGQAADSFAYYGFRPFRWHVAGRRGFNDWKVFPDSLATAMLDTPIYADVGGWDENVEFCWFHREEDASKFLSVCLLKWARSQP